MLFRSMPTSERQHSPMRAGADSPQQWMTTSPSPRRLRHSLTWCATGIASSTRTAAALALKRKFITEAQAVLHGDLHTGSFMVSLGSSSGVNGGGGGFENRGHGGSPSGSPGSGCRAGGPPAAGSDPSAPQRSAGSPSGARGWCHPADTAARSAAPESRPRSRCTSSAGR